MTLENMFTAVVTNARIGWNSCAASRTLQALRHAGDSFEEIFILEH